MPVGSKSVAGRRASEGFWISPEKMDARKVAESFDAKGGTPGEPSLLLRGTKTLNNVSSTDLPSRRP